MKHVILSLAMGACFICMPLSAMEPAGHPEQPIERLKQCNKILMSIGTAIKEGDFTLVQQRMQEFLEIKKMITALLKDGSLQEEQLSIIHNPFALLHDAIVYRDKDPLYTQTFKKASIWNYFPAYTREKPTCIIEEVLQYIHKNIRSMTGNTALHFLAKTLLYEQDLELARMLANPPYKHDFSTITNNSGKTVLDILQQNIENAQVSPQTITDLIRKRAELSKRLIAILQGKDDEEDRCVTC